MEHQKAMPVFFEYLWEEMLDYLDVDFAKDFGKKVWNEIVMSDEIDIQNNDGRERSRLFIYNVALVVIFAEFSKIAFNNYWNDEGTIFLDKSNVKVPGDNMTTFLDKDCVITSDASGTWVELQCILPAIQDAKEFIYKVLRKKYSNEEIYDMIRSAHSEKDAETNTIYSRTQSFGQELDSFSYIDNGFQY